ncbi:C40 family peptidase [Anaerococcus senegalensis]|uniref:C40 family peptidase n=1 Tax=Anaerococcus senegalensis TaxID=1288120 RepID=UPI0002FAC252|nr:C40 family peptidase [Anaerococcus senegalensis]
MSKKNIGSTIGVLAAVTIGATAYASTINNLDKEDQSKKVLDSSVSYIDKEYASTAKKVKKDYANEVSNTKFAEKSKNKKGEKISKSRNLADPTLFESSSEQAIVEAVDKKIESNKEEDNKLESNKEEDNNVVEEEKTVNEVLEESPIIEKFVAVDSLNVRSSKTDQENNVVETIAKNTKVVGRVEDGWLKTDNGYIKLDFLSDIAIVDEKENTEDVLAKETKEDEEAKKIEQAKADEEAKKIEQAKVDEEAKKAEQAKLDAEAKKAEEAKAQENQATSFTGWVNTDALNIRSGADMNSNVVGALTKGDKVSGTLQNGWLKINNNGQVSFVSAQFISNTEVKKPVVEKKQEIKVQNNEKSQTPAPAKQQNTVQSQAYTGWVNTAALNVRSGASTSNNIIGNYTMGDKVSGQLANGWLKVNYNGQTGYISANLLSNSKVQKPQEVVQNNTNNRNNNQQNNNLQAEQTVTQTKQQTPAPQASGSGQSVANIAASMIGNPYVWGGTAPGGFDCSGLVQYAYRQVGVNIARTTYGQAGNGYSVGLGNLQAGDILLFSYNGSIDHVGIVTDSSGNFVHASTPSTGVTTGNVYDPWYKAVCVGARRIF